MRAMTSLFDRSSVTFSSSCTSPHLRKNSWLRSEKRTSTEVMAKTTSLMLKVVGFGRHRTPCSVNSGQQADEMWRQRKGAPWAVRDPPSRKGFVGRRRARWSCRDRWE